MDDKFNNISLNIPEYQAVNDQTYSLNYYTDQ